jgi:hypothetical protein
LRAGEPLSFAEIGELVAHAAAAAPSILAGASYVEAAEYAAGVEDLSRTVEYLQVLSAGTVDRTRTQAIAAADAARAGGSRAGKAWVTGWDNGVETLNETDTNWPGQPAAPITSPADDGCANTAESLRLLLRIGKSEANRRLALAKDILPASTFTGDTIPAPRQHLAAALTPTPTSTSAGNEDSPESGDEDRVEHPAAACPLVSSRAGTIIALTLNRLQHLTTPGKLALIEENLTATAATSDPDFLARVARRWADTIDADGTEPSEEALRHTQGAFIRKPRHGLHHLEIFATTDQYEHLLTVMNTATNPRTTTTATGPIPAGTSGTNDGGTGTTGGQGGNTQDGNTQDVVWNETNAGPDLDRRTRPQKQLEGLVGAAKIALATNALPATGGNRPQIIATSTTKTSSHTTPPQTRQQARAPKPAQGWAPTAAPAPGRASRQAPGPAPAPGTSSSPGPSPPPPCAKSRATPTSSPHSWAPTANSWTSAAKPGSSPQPNAPHSPPATKAAPSPTAPAPPPGAKPTTSPTGPTTAPPTSTTASCSAAATTTSSTKNNGPSPPPTTPPGSNPQNTSTPTKNPNQTPTSNHPHHPANKPVRMTPVPLSGSKETTKAVHYWERREPTTTVPSSSSEWTVRAASPADAMIPAVPAA